MSSDDVVPSEMGSDHDIADEQLERFVEDLRSSFTAQAPAEAETHLAAMFEAAHLLADNGDPVVRPVSNAGAPATQVSRPPKRRRSSMTDKNFLRSRISRVLAPAVAAFMMLGAMASANALPRPMQHAASTAAGWVGLDLPDDEDAVEVPDTTDDPAIDTVSEDDQGEDTQDSTDATSEDDQGDDSQGSDDATSEDEQGDDSQGSDDATSEDEQGDDSQGSGDGTSHDSGTSGSDDSDDSGGSDDSGSGSGSGSSGSGSSGSGSGDSDDNGQD